jgi:6-phosphogluconolactonase
MMRSPWSRFTWLAAFALSLAVLSTDTIRAQKKSVHTVLYASVGEKLIEYDVDLEKGTLQQRGSMTAPASVQEAWPSPSKKYLYVAWSNGGPSFPAVAGAVSSGNHHGVTAYRIDPASGALTQHGLPATLPSRPIYITTDEDATHVITAHNNPSGLTVHDIAKDGTLGGEVRESAKLDFGIYGHQVRVDPSNRVVILVTRGNAPTATKPEDPGALKLFSYSHGILANRQTIAPNGGFDYQVRHIDFHPSGKWVYVTLERQNKLHVYRRSADGTLSDAPIFVKDTLADHSVARSGQEASSIHVHPNGHLVYVANRASDTTDFEGKAVFAGGENTIAVFSINPETGEPTLIQTVDTRGFQPRTFAVDASGSILAVANQSAGLVRKGSRIETVAASLTIFRIRRDGKLDFASKYDLETGGKKTLFWTGIISLPSEP